MPPLLFAPAPATQKALPSTLAAARSLAWTLEVPPSKAEDVNAVVVSTVVSESMRPTTRLTVFVAV